MRNSTNRGLGQHRANDNDLVCRTPTRLPLASLGLALLLTLLAACAPAAPPAPTPAPPPTSPPAQPTAASAAKPPAAATAPAAPAKSTAAKEEVVQITDELVKAAKAEGTLMLRHGSPAAIMEKYTRAFTEQFGISIQVDRKVGPIATQQFASEERANKHVQDVSSTVDIAGLKNMAKEGFLLNYTLPDLKNKLPPGTYIEGWGYSANWTEIVIAYNPKLLPHAEAKELFKTWKGLLDPKMKGRFGLNATTDAGNVFATFLMFYQRPEYGRDFLAKLAAQNPRMYSGAAPGREDVAAGATAVFVPGWEAAEMTEFMKGGQTAWTYPEIAPGFANTFWTVSKNAPHPNAARLFVAWMFGPEGAKATMEGGQRPTLKGVPDTRDAVAKLKQTDWWKPYPEGIRWVPDQEYWMANYDRLATDMKQALGWKG